MDLSIQQSKKLINVQRPKNSIYKADLILFLPKQQQIWTNAKTLYARMYAKTTVMQ